MEEFTMYDILVNEMKQEVTRLGVQELRTPEEVDNVLMNTKGTVLIFVNSVCGCAGAVARPALRLALQHEPKPTVAATVFASTDREATARARTYFMDMPTSSPSFALLRDGKLLCMIHREDIEVSEPAEVASRLTAMFDKHCTPVSR